MNQPGAAVVGRRKSPKGACAAAGAGASAAARSEELRALAQLYDRHAAVVLSLCRGRLGGAGIDEAEDACHETFIRAYRKLLEGHEALQRIEAEVDGGSSARKWLYGIARHVCRERARSRRRREHHEMIAAFHNGAAGMRSSPTGILAPVAERAEMLERLTAAIAQLPDRERLALHVQYLEDHPAPAARAAMGLSRSGYYKLLGRARKLLARRLTHSDRVKP